MKRNINELYNKIRAVSEKSMYDVLISEMLGSAKPSAWQLS